MTTITRRWLGRPRTMLAAQGRLLLPVAAMSAFVNNTPVVAMFLPVLSGWAKRNRLNPSRLFMPLSFAAMLGGTCTLIGTSTNLVVNELIETHAGPGGIRPFGMFTLAWAGVPVLVAGMIYMVVAGRRLLPPHATPLETVGDPREYLVWMRIRAGSPVVGRTIEDAGLRHLSGLYLMQIERGEERLLAVGPTQILHADDRLCFVGVIESVIELQQMQGLEPDTDQITKLHPPRQDRRLIEAVISPSSSLVGKTVRASEFRTRYSAVIIAVHRSGGRVQGKIGDIVLRPGDTLLLEAQPGFARQHRDSASFYLVSELPGTPTPRWSLAWVAIGLLAGLVLVVTMGWLSIMTASLCAAMLMVLTRCCTGTQAREAIDWQVLVVIGTAFGLARAMDKTGLADTLASGVLGWTSGYGPWAMLAGVYLITAIFTSLMTNNAAAALVFPIAFQTAATHGLDFTPFAVCIAVGASTAFATPIGYQTNMMVMGPGGYTWGDFLRFGTPLLVLCGIVCVTAAATLY
jgi:di/tricarboxylate transporter